MPSCCSKPSPQAGNSPDTRGRFDAHRSPVDCSRFFELMSMVTEAPCCSDAHASDERRGSCCPGAPGAAPSPRMLKGTLPPEPSAVPRGISKQSTRVDGVEVTRVTFAPGARWSVDLAPKAGTPSCTAPHVALVLSGRLRVRMDDGSEEEFSKDDVMLLPPGHDAWTVGDAPCVFVEFSQGWERYGGAAGADRHG